MRLPTPFRQKLADLPLGASFSNGHVRFEPGCAEDRRGYSYRPQLREAYREERPYPPAPPPILDPSPCFNARAASSIHYSLSGPGSRIANSHYYSPLYAASTARELTRVLATSSVGFDSMEQAKLGERRHYPMSSPLISHKRSDI